MSRIDDLIAESCPAGVPFYELQSMFDTRNGYTPSKSDPTMWTDGSVPWFRMEDLRDNGGVLASAIQSIPERAVKGGRLFPANSILVATSATIGEHALITVPHLSNQRFTSLALKSDLAEQVDMKFVYYYCFALDEWCLGNTSTSSFASVDMAGFKRFKFPVPPLEVQREIVRILDQFTQLEAELEAELEARTRQYAHYRHGMVSKARFASCEWVPLTHIASIRTGVKPGRVADSGGVPYINAGNDPSGFVATSNTRGGVITIPSRGQGGAGHVGFQLADFWCGPLCYRVESTSSRVSTKFLYYFLKNMQADLVALRKVGSIPAVNKSDLGQVLVPLVDIGEQRRAVQALDEFDSLVNDISMGLPAELAARRKQYEYYRDRLLTFKEAK